jgi:hypothetical protein
MRHLLAALIVPVSVLAGCPGTLDDPASFYAGLGIDGGGGGGGGGAGGDAGGGCPSPPPSFGTTCSVSGCHAATMPAGGLDLASPNIVMRLSGKQATGGPGLLIDPTTPAASVLYTKLTATPPFGARMPLVGAPLSDADIAGVLSWIECSTK